MHRHGCSRAVSGLAFRATAFLAVGGVALACSSTIIEKTVVVEGCEAGECKKHPAGGTGGASGGSTGSSGTNVRDGSTDGGGSAAGGAQGTDGGSGGIVFPGTGAMSGSAGDIGDATPICEPFVDAGKPVPVDAYVLYDQSSSMGTAYPGSNPQTSWWQMAQTAFSAFVDDTRASGMGLGIQYFPLGGVDPQSCDVSLYQKPDVGIGLLPGNAAALVHSIDAHAPEAFTPTVPALTGAVNYMSTWASAHPGRQPAVVLVTDGYPTECPEGVQIADVVSVAKTALAGTPSIPTFVIGFADAGSLDNLDQVAQAGGTESAHVISSGDLNTQFTEAMLALVNSPLFCRFGIPDFSMIIQEPEEPDLVSVAIEPTTGGARKEVPKVGSAGGCDANAQAGWYFDSPTNPTEILLCPASCSMLSASRLNIEYGCNPTTAPNSGSDSN